MIYDADSAYEKTALHSFLPKTVGRTSVNLEAPTFAQGLVIDAVRLLAIPCLETNYIYVY